ncbi:MAG: hypothetical protein COW63_12410 [Bacteroidetes bacterium CG18_big_fil_WC_8_21_14_2_50_41_14]|nr:MAG: hypothetical protein COW63_12410 [Bacteroidetes bacterium CG18_big_fil_WC_8_21_14_2_50_41_14]
MKKITYFTLFLAIISFMSCSKSSSPPDVIYTVKYTVTSSGDVQMDTIQYKNISGEMVTKISEPNLDYTFTSPNGYNASLYVSGNIENGEVFFNMQVTNSTGTVYIDSTSWNNINTGASYQFKKKAEAYYSSSK